MKIFIYLYLICSGIALIIKLNTEVPFTDWMWVVNSMLWCFTVLINSLK